MGEKIGLLAPGCGRPRSPGDRLCLASTTYQARWISEAFGVRARTTFMECSGATAARDSRRGRRAAYGHAPDGNVRRGTAAPCRDGDRRQRPPAAARHPVGARSRRRRWRPGVRDAPLAHAAGPAPGRGRPPRPPPPGMAARPPSPCGASVVPSPVLAAARRPRPGGARVGGVAPTVNGWPDRLRWPLARHAGGHATVVAAVPMVLVAAMATNVTRRRRWRSRISAGWSRDGRPGAQSTVRRRARGGEARRGSCRATRGPAWRRAGRRAAGTVALPSSPPGGIARAPESPPLDASGRG